MESMYNFGKEDSPVICQVYGSFEQTAAHDVQYHVVFEVADPRL